MPNYEEYPGKERDKIKSMSSSTVLPNHCPTNTQFTEFDVVLLPCPFCGAIPNLRSEFELFIPNAFSYWIECPTDNCLMDMLPNNNPIISGIPEKIELVTKWNSRTFVKMGVEI